MSEAAAMDAPAPPAAPPDANLYQNKIQSLQDAGFSSEEVGNWQTKVGGTLMAAGFGGQEINDYMGVKTPDMSGVHQMAMDNLQKPQPEEGAQKQPKTFQDVLDTALGMPAADLVKGQPKPLPAPLRGHLVDAYQNGTADNAGDFMSQVTPYVSGLANNFLLSLTTSLKTGPELAYARATGNKALADSMISDVNAANFAREQADPHINSFAGRMAYNTASTVLDALPALGAMALNPVAGAAAFAGQAGSEEYGQASAKGATPTGAAVSGAVSGAVNLLPMGPFAKILGKTGLSQFLQHSVMLVGANVTASEISSATDKALADPNKTWGQWLQEQPEAMTQAAMAGLAFAGVGAASHIGAKSDAGTDAAKDVFASHLGKDKPSFTAEDMIGSIRQHLATNETAPPRETFNTVASFMFGHEHAQQGGDILMQLYKETGVTPIKAEMESQIHPEIVQDLEDGKIPAVYAGLVEKPEAAPVEQEAAPAQAAQAAPPPEIFAPRAEAEKNPAQPEQPSSYIADNARSMQQEVVRRLQKQIRDMGTPGTSEDKTQLAALKSNLKVENTALRKMMDDAGINRGNAGNLKQRPLSLTGFITRNGGIKDVGGDLRAMDLHKQRRMRGIINENGLDPDKMRELAQEAGFLPPDDPNNPSQSTTNDLYALIEKEAGGEKVYSEKDSRAAAYLGALKPFDEVENNHQKEQFEQNVAELTRAADENNIPIGQADIAIIARDHYTGDPKEDIFNYLDFHAAGNRYAAYDHEAETGADFGLPGDFGPERFESDATDGGAGEHGRPDNGAEAPGSEQPILDTRAESAADIARRNADKRIKGAVPQKGVNDLDLFDENGRQIASQKDMFSAPAPINHAPSAKEFADFAKDYPQTPEGMREAAKWYVITKGRESGVEHFVGLGKNGEGLGINSGIPNHVDLPAHMKELLYTGSGDFEAHHNHPSGSSLGVDDLSMLVFDGISKVVAHANDGTVSYEASLAQGMNDALYKKGSSTSEINERYEELKKIAESGRKASHKATQDGVTNRTIPVQPTDDLSHGSPIIRDQTTLFGQAMERAGIIDFKTDRPLAVIPKDIADEIVKTTVAAIKRGLKRYGITIERTSEQGVSAGRGAGAGAVSSPSGIENTGISIEHNKRETAQAPTIQKPHERVEGRPATARNTGPRLVERSTDAPARDSLSPDHAALEDNLGVPENMNPSQLGKLAKKIDGIFAGTEQKGLPKAQDLTDPQFEAMEEYARRVEKAGGMKLREDATKFEKSDKTDTPEFKNWFGSSKVVDAEGKPQVMYRGDFRGDKLGESFKHIEGEEGGSGGIYFTSDPAIASSYAHNKSYMDDYYDNVLDNTQVVINGKKKTLPQANAWLTKGQKEGIEKAVLSVGDHGDYNGSGAEDPFIGKATWDDYLKRNGGNYIKAVDDVLLKSGSLSLEDFLRFWKETGTFDHFTFDDPSSPRPLVTPVYLSIEKPFVVNDSTPEDMQKIKAIAGEDNTIDQIEHARKNGFAETISLVTPQFRDALQKLGYDGIKDVGGKVTGSDEHTVYIAFRPEQIKSIHNKGTFDPNDARILREQAQKFIPPATKEDLADRLKFAPEQIHSLVRKVADSDVVYNTTMFANPDAASSNRARAQAKDVADAMNWARWHGTFQFDNLTKLFKLDELKQMYLDREETSLFMRRLEANGMDRASAEAEARKDKIGVFRDGISEGQRGVMDQLNKWAEGLQKELAKNGMLKNGDIPYWTPRVGAMMDEEGNWRRFNVSDKAAPEARAGRGITKSSPHLLHRAHETMDDTESALKELAEQFGIKDAELVKDIRILPLAMAKLETAVATRKMINDIIDLHKTTGSAFTGGRPQWEGTFTLDHPAFTRYRPEFDDEGNVRKDVDGNPVMEKVSLNIPREYEGSLKALLQNKDPAIYRHLMTMKRLSMENIMWSPLIHRQVLWGKALAAHPAGIITGQIMAAGERGVQDPVLMKRAILSGMVPMGHRGMGNDVGQIMAGDRNLVPGRSLLAKGAGKAVGMVNPEAGQSVMRGIDAAGQKLHDEWLWGWAGKLQMGIFTHETEALQKQGVPQEAADQSAAHSANLFAGVIPKESMGQWATRLTNLMLFSRSFTFTNIGIVKSIAGLPGNIKARIERDSGPEVMRQLNSISRKKAFGTFMRDIAMAYVGTGLVQNFFNMYNSVQNNNKDEGLGEKLMDAVAKERDAYGRRMKEAFNDYMQTPYALWKLPVEVAHISPVSENEIGKEMRVYMGSDKNGTGHYLRLPTGKVGEDIMNWFTKPATALLQKMAPQAKAIGEDIANSDAFGHHIYDPEVSSPGGYIRRAGIMAQHFMESFVPVDNFQALGNIFTGKATQHDYEVLGGSATGLTTSKGYPGGKEAALEHEATGRYTNEFEMARPSVKAAVAAGDDAKAHEIMDKIKVPKREQDSLIRYYKNPSPGSRAMSKFQKIATPEEKEQMDRYQNGEDQP